MATKTRNRSKRSGKVGPGLNLETYPALVELRRQLATMASHIAGLRVELAEVNAAMKPEAIAERAASGDLGRPGRPVAEITAEIEAHDAAVVRTSAELERETRRAAVEIRRAHTPERINRLEAIHSAIHSLVQAVGDLDEFEVEMVRRGGGDPRAGIGMPWKSAKINKIALDMLSGWCHEYEGSGFIVG